MPNLTKVVDGIVVPLSPTEEKEFYEREAEHAAFLAEQALLRYQGLRKLEYPSLDDLVVALVEEKEGRPEALTALMAKRQEIKLKYPKPSEE